MKNLFMRKRGIILSSICLLYNIFISHSVLAQTNTWNGSSNEFWNTAANWSLNEVPTSAHDVVIPNSLNVTVNTAAVCASLTIEGGNAANTITISSGQSLNISGSIIINSGTTNGDHKTVAVGSGTLSCGSISMAVTGSFQKINRITISTGTVTAVLRRSPPCRRNLAHRSGASAPPAWNRVRPVQSPPPILRTATTIWLSSIPIQNRSGRLPRH